MVLSPGEIPFGDNLSMKVFTLPSIDNPIEKEPEVDMTSVLAMQAKLAKLDSIDAAKEKQATAYQDSLERANATNAGNNKEMLAQKEKNEKIGTVKYPIKYLDSTNFVLVKKFI